MADIILYVGILLFAAHIFASIFNKTKVPDVLLLMLVGICAGPIFSLVQPDQLGIVGKIASSVALVIILFDGGLNLRMRNITDSIKITFVLTLTTFLCTMILVGVSAILFFQINPIVAFMLGAILGGTSSAVVIPIIRLIKIEKLPFTALFLESAITDVLCIVVSMSLMDAFVSGQLSTGKIIGGIISSLLLSSIVGALAGYAYTALLKKLGEMPNTGITTMAYIFVVYGIAEFLGYSGGIAVLATGIAIANLKDAPHDTVLSLLRLNISPKREISVHEASFFEEMVFLLKTYFFVYLGISISFGNANIFIFGAAVILMIYGARIIIVNETMPKMLCKRDATTMSVLVPKGLAAAVLASFPLERGISGGELVRDTTYIVVFLSIVVSATMVALLERNFINVRNFYSKCFTTFSDQPSENQHP